MQTKKIGFLFLIAVIAVTSAGISCGGGSGGLTPGAPEPITLEYWRTFDDSASFTPLINAYRASFPNVSIKYRIIRFEDFEGELLNALAEDRGPDLYSIPNTWIHKYEAKIEPLPETITTKKLKIQGTLKKEEFTETTSEKTLSLRSLKNNYIDVVEDDVYFNEKIYGLPLSVDTLVMFFNRDLLNNAGITTPPETWTDFQKNITKLTIQDRRNNILQSGAAIGTAENISRPADLLSLLMMQNGTVMSDSNNFAFFHKMPEQLTGRSALPSVEALNFYTDFAKPTKQVYTWNEDLPQDIDAFIAGKTAFFFGYSYHIPIIKSQAPKLNFEINSIPQIAGNPAVNYANYWVETVSKKSQNVDQAWHFIQFITNATNAKTYLDATQKPTALRSLIEEQLEDLTLSPFASQLLTTKSWYRGKDPDAAEEIMKGIITQNIEGLIETEKIIRNGASKINQTIR